jgi:hypothetical protein
LRELPGVNSLLVGDWIKAHADKVISHNSKYGMQNAKNPSSPLTKLLWALFGLDICLSAAIRDRTFRSVVSSQ